MLYKSVVILGIGTLGGFIANALSNLDILETLVIIDHDKVEYKNLKNSIYRQIDIGASKTEALIEIIRNKNTDLTILAMNEKYIEGKTKIPKCDLVIDCRDYTYDRRKEIDVRLYISSRYLMVDTRKNVGYKIKTEGRYISELTKQDFRYAGILIGMLLEKNTISQLLKLQSVQKYELDYIKHLQDYSYDVIYENHQCGNKFVNLSDKLVPIIDTNKNYPMKLFIGNQKNPINELTIPKNTLNSSHDIITKFLDIIKKNFNFFFKKIGN